MAAEPAPSTFTGQNLSVVVPFRNEGQNVTAVLRELRDALPEAEVIAVDDGSHDETWTRICRIDGVRGIRFLRHQGQSAAIYHGLHAARRPVVGLMDGDGQSDPVNFNRLLAKLETGDVDVVCGYRVDRQDPWNRRAASRIANGIRRFFLDDGVRDTGCSQKVFRAEAVNLLVPFRGLHRYLPALFKQAGLRITEVPVAHRPRRAGISNYNNRTRAWDGIYDLVGVAWLLNRKIVPPDSEEKPPVQNLKS